MKAGKFFLLLTASKTHNNTITYVRTPAAARALKMTMQEWNGLDKVSLKAKLIICIINNTAYGFYEKSPAYPVAKPGELLETLLIFYDM